MAEDKKDQYFLKRTFAEVCESGRTFEKRKKIGGAFLYENTTTLLFSRTNYGKSILSFQFAYAAATGTSIFPCPALINECDPMKTLLVDLELEDIDIWERHGFSHLKDETLLSNLLYLHEKMDKTMILGFKLLDKIEQAAREYRPKLIVIDNISKLLPDALKPDIASNVISVLNRIRKILKCSILVIGHTTKGNPNLRVNPSDYYGSAMMQNFFNELSFIDKTKDENFFICHAKTKRAETYDKSVPVFERGDNPKTGLGFNFIGMQNIADIQLPATIDLPYKRKHNLSEFKPMIDCLLNAGYKQFEIAKFCDCSQANISHICSSKT